MKIRWVVLKILRVDSGNRLCCIPVVVVKPVTLFENEILRSLKYSQQYIRLYTCLYRSYFKGMFCKCKARRAVDRRWNSLYLDLNLLHSLQVIVSAEMAGWRGYPNLIPVMCRLPWARCLAPNGSECPNVCAPSINLCTVRFFRHVDGFRC
jgi:hypothetical protein